jgi:uncharacterized membrane protein
MSLKTKIMNTLTAHPKLVTFSIGLAITFVIGAAIGMVDHQAFAHSANQNNQGSSGS